MATQLEQILLKLGVDQSEVGPALEEFSNKVGKSTKHASEFFKHVGNEGRAFHKVLEKINEAVPGLGNLFQLAINPIVGALAGATMAFTYFNKQIEEANKEMEHMEEVFAKPLSNFKKSASEAAEEIRKLKREFDKWWEATHDKPEKKILNKLETDLTESAQGSDLEEKQLRANGNLPAGAVEREVQQIHIAQAKHDLNLTAEAKDKIAKEFADVNSKVINARGEVDSDRFKKREELISHTRTKVSGLESRESQYAQLLEEAQRKVTDLSSTAASSGDKQINRDLKLAQEKADKLQTLYDGNNDELEKARKHLGELNDSRTKEVDKLHELEQRYDALNASLQGLDKATVNAQTKLDNLSKAPLPGQQTNLDPFRATLQEMAQQGQWITQRRGRFTNRYWQPTENAIDAMRIEAIEAEGKAAGILSRNPKDQWALIRDRDANAARLLRDQLGARGELKTSEYLDSMSKDLDLIKQLAQGIGVNINPSNGK